MLSSLLYSTILKGNGGGGFAYDASYQAVLDRATALGYSQPTNAQKLVQNQLVLDLKAAGLWARLDIFYTFANDGSAEFATLNWISPLNHQATLVNSPTFTSNVGFNSDNVSSYINCNINFSTQFVKATLTSASKFAYKSSNTGIARITGIVGSTADRWQAASNIGWSIHAQQNASASADSTGAGFHMVSRSSSTAINHKNPTTSTNATTTVNTRQNANLALFAEGTGFSDSSLKLNLFGYGENMESDYATLKTIFDDYMGSL